MQHRIEKEYDKTGHLIKETIYNKNDNRKMNMKLFSSNGDLFGEIIYQKNGHLQARRYLNGTVIEIMDFD